MNSRAKGKRGELELVHKLREYGFDVRRGQQYNGADGSADIIGIYGLHIECKRVEQLNIEKALQQSVNDSKGNEFPVVMHRKNGDDWKVTMRLSDFVHLWSRNGERLMKVCRFCTNYRPDARYKGVIGWCEVKDDATDVKTTCISFKKGKQMWLQGVPVEEMESE